MSDEKKTNVAGEAQPLRRDRGARSTGKRSRGVRSIPLLLASVAAEIVGEIVFAALIVLVSFLIYGEVRWLFAAAVWLGVNAVLMVIALLVWGRRRRSR